MGKRNQELLERLLSQVAGRVSQVVEQPPLLSSDQLPGYEEVIVEVFGEVPAYSGRGRPPTRKRATSKLCYGQVVKHRGQGRVIAVTKRMIFGDAEPSQVSTTGVERTQLSSRQSNGRLVRKTLSFSKKREMLEWACAWEDLVYNFAHAVKTLRLRVQQGRRKWQPRTPTMAVGLTDHVWSIKELDEFHVPQKA